MTADELLSTCERVLALVGTDAEAEVAVSAGNEALTRFATSFIHQNVAEDISHVVLRIALDGRTASSSLDGPTDELCCVTVGLLSWKMRLLRIRTPLTATVMGAFETKRGLRKRYEPSCARDTGPREHRRTCR